MPARPDLTELERLARKAEALRELVDNCIGTLEQVAKFSDPLIRRDSWTKSTIHYVCKRDAELARAAVEGERDE